MDKAQLDEFHERFSDIKNRLKEPDIDQEIYRLWDDLVIAGIGTRSNGATHFPSQEEVLDNIQRCLGAPRPKKEEATDTRIIVLFAVGLLVLTIIVCGVLLLF